MDKLEIIKGFFNANKRYYNELVQKKTLSKLSVNASELFQKVHKETAPIFVLSTGRCGTELLTNILRQNKELTVFHEPVPELLYHSKYAYENPNNETELKAFFEAARYELIRNSFVVKKRYVETNNRITFFANQIASIYPQAKFIHLVRNPLKFVESGVNRNWYSNENINDEGRIKYKDNTTWESYSLPEKCAWLWNETNSFIEIFKSKNSEKVLTITSEKLFSDTAVVNEINQFLGLKKVNEKLIEEIIKKPTNKGKGNFSLSDTQKQKVLLLTPLSKKYGY